MLDNKYLEWTRTLEGFVVRWRGRAAQAQRSMLSTLSIDSVRRVARGICLIVAPFAVIALGLTSVQTTQREWFDNVPSAKRARLVLRLEQYFEFERNSEYERLYELFSEQELEALKPMTRDDYVKFRKHASSKVLSFKPLSSGYDEITGKYVIGGQAEIAENNTFKIEIVHIYATLRNDEWFFSGLYTSLDNPGGIGEPLTTTSPTFKNKPDLKKPQKLRKPFR